MAHHALMADGRNPQEHSKVSSSERVVLVCSERLTKDKGKKPVLSGAPHARQAEEADPF